VQWVFWVKLSARDGDDVRGCVPYALIKRMIAFVDDAAMEPFVVDSAKRIQIYC